MSGDFPAALRDSSEVDLTVTGRVTGRRITNPVWFVTENDTIYLVPVHGAGSDWYKNVAANPQIELAADSASATVTATPVMDAGEVSDVVDKFRAKYGAGQVSRYYAKVDAAVEAHLA